MFASEILLMLILLIVVLCIVFIRNRYSFWARQGVPFVPALFPLGNIQHSSHLMLELYRDLKGRHPFGGLFQFIEPVAMITDPEMVKNVTVRDFRHFYDRGGYFNAEHDVLSANMINREGKRWTALRHATSPIFASGKIKAFFPVMVHMIDCFREHLNAKLNAESDKIDLKDVLGRLNTDISTRFLTGVDGNCLTAPNGGLYGALCRETFRIPSGWKLFFMTCFRSLANKMRLKQFSRQFTQLMLEIVQDSIDHRRQYPDANRRSDLIDQLLKFPGVDGIPPLTAAEISSELFLFFAASEGTGIMITYCLYELAQNPDVQDRARQCVFDTVAKHGGLTYEAVADMPYIEQCLNETLRKYPLAINLIRVVTEDYPVPDSSGVVLRKGLNVIIPVYAIHHDPEYYPNPERFDPDRFSPEACRQRIPYTFLPFGQGPKICMGYRHARVYLRVMLAMLVHNYEFKCCPEMRESQSKSHTVMKLDGGLWFKVSRIE